MQRWWAADFEGKWVPGNVEYSPLLLWACHLRLHIGNAAPDSVEKHLHPQNLLLIGSLHIQMSSEAVCRNTLVIDTIETSCKLHCSSFFCSVGLACWNSHWCMRFVNSASSPPISAASCIAFHFICSTEPWMLPFGSRVNMNYVLGLEKVVNVMVCSCKPAVNGMPDALSV